MKFDLAPAMEISGGLEALQLLLLVVTVPIVLSTVAGLPKEPVLLVALALGSVAMFVQ